MDQAIATIDRLDVRREIGAAAHRIETAFRADLDSKASERARLHKEWRDLQDKASQAQQVYDKFMRRFSKGTEEDHDLLDRYRKEHPDLLFHEHDEYAPITCTATGLALFEGDVTFGTPEYGAVLAIAVALKVDPVAEGLPTAEK